MKDSTKAEIKSKALDVYYYVKDRPLVIAAISVALIIIGIAIL